MLLNSMKVLDSRRLTGHNLLQERPGAVLDVSLDPAEAEIAVSAWRDRIRSILDAVGWMTEANAVRYFPGGASLAFSAPIDCLYTATEINEEAWRAAETAVRGEAPPDIKEVAARFRARISLERNPTLLTLQAAAEARGVAFLADDDTAAVGLGAGALSWPVDALPPPEEIPWEYVHNIPVILVSGTNGKTTTVRLLAAMARSAGLVAGFTSTESIEVAGEVIDRGDFSGPGGARILLRDPRVELAILETARGGLLRRGLALRQAEAAVVTNIAADHLGEHGVVDLAALADVKMVLARAVGSRGRLVLNADDPLLVARAYRSAAPVDWFSLNPARAEFQALLQATATAWVLHGDEIERWHSGSKQTLAHVQDIPITFDGAARHNVANALAALALGAAVRLPNEAMLRALRQMHGTTEDNPGRGNLLELGGTRILLDYAHNPHGLAAILSLAASLPARRRLLVLGQVGDRDDVAIRNLAHIAWDFRPDRIVIKEIPEMLRGRPVGEVSSILNAEFRRMGATSEDLDFARNEVEAVHQALTWARSGDLLILLIHAQRDAVLDLLRRISETQWQAGQPMRR